MNEMSILNALKELEKWKLKKAELQEELKKVNAQVLYYEGLVEGMKKEVAPSSLAKLLAQLEVFV